MKQDEKRLLQLADHPDRDEVMESDIPIIRSGLINLNWVDRPTEQGGRCCPFVTADPQALKYYHKNGRLTPAHRRTLRELTSVKRSDIDWVREWLKPKVGRK